MEEPREAKKRPWRSAHLPRHFLVRLTEEEHTTIAQRARRARLSASRYLARCALRGKPPVREAPPPASRGGEEMERLLFYLFQVSQTLSALALRYRAADRDDTEPPSLSEVEAAARGVSLLLSQIRRRL